MKGEDRTAQVTKAKKCDKEQMVSSVGEWRSMG